MMTDKYIIRSIICYSSLHLKYQSAWLNIGMKYCCSIWWIKKTITISNRNKGFDCSNVNVFVRFNTKFQRNWIVSQLTVTYMYILNYMKTMHLYATIMRYCCPSMLWWWQINNGLHHELCPLSMKYLSLFKYKSSCKTGNAK